MKRLAIITAILANGLLAQMRPQQDVGTDTTAATSLPEQLKDVGVDQKLNQTVALDAVFSDDTGAARPLREYLSGRPAILVPVYYECPMLCHMILNGVLRTLRIMPLNVGRDFDVIAFSFDPSENAQNARAKRYEYTERYARAGTEAGWKFLTGSPESIRALTGSIGYRYDKDPKSGQWNHASAIVILTPEGRVSKYFFGVEFSARDLRLGLVEASANKIGTLADVVLLYCFHYDPSIGKYTTTVMGIMRLAAAATVLGLISFWIISWRQSKHRNVERLPAIS